MVVGCWLLIAALLPAAPARAEHEPIWELGAGVAIMRLPDYRGSSERRNYLIPYPYLIYRAERWRIDRDGFRSLLLDSPNAKLDFSVNAAVPVNSDKNTARQGMDDIDPLLELGLSLEIYLDRRDPMRTWKLEVPLRAVFETDLTHFTHRGWVLNPHIEYIRRYPLNGRPLRVSLSAGPLFADRQYHQTIYGVPAHFATAERPAYQAAAGYSGTRLLLLFNKYFNHKLRIGGFVRYDTLSGAAFDDSPLFRQNHSLMTGVAITWVLAHSEKTALHRD